MNAKQKAVSLVLMLAVLGAALGLILHTGNVRRSLQEEEAALRVELQESAEGERGFKTIDARKRPLWDLRDELLGQEREIQASIDDLEASTERMRQQLGVCTQYRRRAEQARSENETLTAQIAALSGLTEDTPEVRSAREAVAEGRLTPEEAAAQLAAVFGVESAPGEDVSAPEETSSGPSGGESTGS